MKVASEYDWVVIGEHPAALLSGCIAARLGYSVLWVKHYPMAPVTRLKSGMVLDPESSFFSGWLERSGSKSFFTELLAWLSQGEGDVSLLSEIASVRTQLLTRDVRSDLQESLEDTVKSFLANQDSIAVGSFFTDRLDALSSLLSGANQVSPDLFVSEDWNLKIKTILEGAQQSKKRYQKVFNRKEVLSFIRNTAQTRSHLMMDLIQDLEKKPEDWGEPEWVLQTLFRAFFLEHQGVQIPGGVQRLFKFLEAIGKKWGISDLRNFQIQQLFFEKGRFLGLQLKDSSQRGSMIGVKGGVIGCCINHLNDLIEDDGKKHSNYGLKKSPQPEGWRFTLGIKVPSQAIPPGIGARSIWVDRGAPHVEFELVPQGGTATLYLRTVLPFKSYTLDPEYQKRMAARLLRVATEQLPFLETHIQDVSQGNYSFASLEMIPENLRFVDRGGVGSSSGLGNLFVATGESYPELGVIGAYLSGIQSISEFYKLLFPKAAAV